MADDQEKLSKIIQRMGDPSWLILHVLEPSHGIPGIEIIQRAEALMREAEYPQRRLDPSTVHYALRRMEQDGLVKNDGVREVEVPGPRGSKRTEPRSMYIITGLGSALLGFRDRLDQTARRKKTALGQATAAGVRS